jgi:hypothetical protein
MKEDILEQIVDDYLQSNGYFTRHNIKFRPQANHPDHEPKRDVNYSDIDVIGYHPKRSGTDRVWAVSCKSWQAGFRVDAKLEELERDKIVSGRRAWKAFRELMKPKWSEAFVEAIEAETGTRKFTYVLAVTRVVGDRRHWETYPRFTEAMQGNPIRMLDLSEMLHQLQDRSTTTVASSEIGRVLQLMWAAQRGTGGDTYPAFRR